MAFVFHEVGQVRLSFKSRLSLYFFAILLVLNFVQYSEVYGLPRTHAPALKSPINSSLESSGLMNSNLANRSVIIPSAKVTTTHVPNQIENIVTIATGALITGATTAAGLFLGWYFVDLKRDRQTRPVLRIDHQDNPHVARKDINIYDVSKPDLPPQYRSISRLDLSYRVNRIKVINDGNSAAEDCKGIIIQNGTEMKVCWYVPTERHKMTINAKSYEYLDLCGFREGDPIQIAKTLKENIKKLPETYPDSTNTSVKLEEVRNLRFEFLDQYPKDEDIHNLIEKHLPCIIAPTENDWLHPPNLNWVLKSGEARIRITSKNAAPIEYKIQILKEPEKDKIIKLIK